MIMSKVNEMNEKLRFGDIYIRKIGDAITSYMRDNPISWDGMAKKLNIAPTTLKRVMKEHSTTYIKSWLNIEKFLVDEGYLERD